MPSPSVAAVGAEMVNPVVSLACKPNREAATPETGLPELSQMVKVTVAVVSPSAGNEVWDTVTLDLPACGATT